MTEDSDTDGGKTGLVVPLKFMDEEDPSVHVGVLI